MTLRTASVLAIPVLATLTLSACASGGTTEVATAPEAGSVPAAGGTAGAAPVSVSTGTVWDGVYTDAQADRGWDTYLQQCSLCHSEAMTGGPGSPGIVGPGFMANWEGQSVADLFGYVKAMMPPGLAGSLSDQQYADLVAVILQGNEFPASPTAEVPADPSPLREIRLTPARP